MSANLSPHFTYEESIHSQIAERLGIENIPAPHVLQVMREAAAGMERVRFYLGAPISISSWFRSLELNRKLGSKDTSQHLKGEAIDFICPGFGSPLDICKELVKHIEEIHFDQLILEHTWVHISFAVIPPREPRKQVLSLLHSGGYAQGLTDSFGKKVG